METEYEFIKGYEGLYKINKQGHIWSCVYKKIMKLQSNENGYYFVNLKSPDGIYCIKRSTRHKCLLHRLLALQWIENPNNEPTVDHIDRNIKNNNLSNLRWASLQEQRDNRNRTGCVYSWNRGDKTYWKASYPIGRGLNRKVLQSNHKTKELAEQWLINIKNENPDK